ncbi:MAG: GumC family protein [Deltaproteobacteria bacterium]|nr:GumC family protein [Deltaproteobacteria bacterium]
MDREPFESMPEVHLRDYFRVLRKRQGIIITCLVVITAVTAIFTFHMTPVYRATAMLLIEKENPNVVSFQEVMAVDASGTDFYQTQYQIIKSRSIAKAVIDLSDLRNSEEFNPEDRDSLLGRVSQTFSSYLSLIFSSASKMLETEAFPGQGDDLAWEEALVDEVVKRIKTEPVRNSRMVKVHFDAADRVLAARAANAVARAYIDFNLDLKMNVSQQASDWLNRKIDEQRKQLELSEQALQAYKEKHNIISMEDRQNITINKLSELNLALMRAENRRMEANARYRQVQEAMRSGSLDAAPELMSNPVIQSLLSSEARLLQSMAELSRKYGERHPRMIGAREELKAIKQRLQGEVRRIASALKKEYQISMARERSLHNALEEQKLQSQKLYQDAIQLGVLRREVESNQQIYDMLLKRLKETDLSMDSMRFSNVQIVDRAEVPLKPIKPRKKLNLLLSLIFGLFSGIGLAFFVEYLDNTIKTPEDVMQHLGLMVLAVVPTYHVEGKARWALKSSSP